MARWLLKMTLRAWILIIQVIVCGGKTYMEFWVNLMVVYDDLETHEDDLKGWIPIKCKGHGVWKVRKRTFEFSQDQGCQCPWNSWRWPYWGYYVGTHTCQATLGVFPGVTLIFNGTLRNIQGNLTGMGTMSCSQVSATLSKIGHICIFHLRTLNELQWL